MLLGFGAAAIVEVLLCALLSGIHGMQLYAELLTSRYIEALSPLPALMINIYAISKNLDIDSPVLSGVLVVLTLGVAGIAVWKAPYWRSLAAAVAGSLLIAPHVFRYDASFLLLPLWLVMFVSKSSFRALPRSRWWFRYLTSSPSSANRMARSLRWRSWYFSSRSPEKTIWRVTNRDLPQAPKLLWPPEGTRAVEVPNRT